MEPTISLSSLSLSSSSARSPSPLSTRVHSRLLFCESPTSYNTINIEKTATRDSLHETAHASKFIRPSYNQNVQDYISKLDTSNLKERDSNVCKEKTQVEYSGAAKRTILRNDLNLSPEAPATSLTSITNFQEQKSHELKLDKREAENIEFDISQQRKFELLQKNCIQNFTSNSTSHSSSHIISAPMSYLDSLARSTLDLTSIPTSSGISKSSVCTSTSTDACPSGHPSRTNSFSPPSSTRCATNSNVFNPMSPKSINYTYSQSLLSSTSCFNLYNNYSVESTGQIALTPYTIESTHKTQVGRIFTGVRNSESSGSYVAKVGSLVGNKETESSVKIVQRSPVSPLRSKDNIVEQVSSYDKTTIGGSEALEALWEISVLVNAGLDRELLGIAVELCELGVNPVVLAEVLQNLRAEARRISVQSTSISSFENVRCKAQESVPNKNSSIFSFSNSFSDSRSGFDYLPDHNSVLSLNSNSILVADHDAQRSLTTMYAPLAHSRTAIVSTYMKGGIPSDPMHKNDYKLNQEHHKEIQLQKKLSSQTVNQCPH